MNYEPSPPENFDPDPAVAVAQDLELELLLKGTVGRQLDAQRGRASAAFARAMQNASPAGEPVLARIGTRDPHVRRLKYWAEAASALAACLAVVVGLQLSHRSNTTITATPHPTTPVVDQVEMSRNVDGGTIVWDNEPLRVVRQQTVKKTQWFDPNEKATYSVVEPVEKVGYERLLPY
jgi:hypothetical protein